MFQVAQTWLILKTLYCTSMPQTSLTSSSRKASADRIDLDKGWQVILVLLTGHLSSCVDLHVNLPFLQTGHNKIIPLLYKRGIILLCPVCFPEQQKMQ